MFFKLWLESNEENNFLFLPNFKSEEERKKAYEFQNAMKSGKNLDIYFDLNDNLDTHVANGLKYEKQVELIYNKDMWGTATVLPNEDMYDMADLIKLGQEIKIDKSYKELLDYLVENLGAKKFMQHLLNQENLGYRYHNQLSGNTPSSKRVIESIKSLADNNQELALFIGNIDNTREFLKRMLKSGIIDEDRFNEIL